MALALILIVPACAAIVSAASRRMAPWVTLAAMLTTLALAIFSALHVTDGGLIYEAHGRLSLDAFAALYLLLVAFVGVTAALYSVGYLGARMALHVGGTSPVDRHGKTKGDFVRARQYYALFNLFLVSMLAVPLVSNLAVIWIAIELTTIFSAFLVAHEDRPEALEAAWKYVALTSMGAMIALFGVLVLYYGIHHAGQPITWRGLTAAAPHMHPAILLVSFALWLVGFGAKAGLVPLHTWLPDAHSQAPASICALLSGVETSGALYMLLRIYPALVANPKIAHPAMWYLVAGLITTGAAAFLLIQVQDFKRLFAYSTVEHMGIILTACGLGAAAHELGAVYQFFAHAFTKSFCFYAAGLAAVVFGTQEISAVRGLISRSAVAGWALVVGAVAIAGAPPFALFISEFQILATGYGNGQYLATSLLTAFIVLAFIAILYRVGPIVFGEPAAAGKTRLPATSVAALVLAFIPIFVFGFYLPPPLTKLIHHAAALLGGAA
jgi:hydrogenase-4 component F